MNERASADAERLEGARVNTCAAVMTSCTCEEVLSRLILDPVGSQGAALATSLNALVVGLFVGPTRFGTEICIIVTSSFRNVDYEMGLRRF